MINFLERVRKKGAVVLLAFFCSQGATVLPLKAQSTLRIGAIPDQNPERLNRRYGQLATELSDKLNVPVRYIPVSNYSAAVSAFRTGSLDLVWFGGLTGIQARLQTPGAQVLTQRAVDANFNSVFVANTSAGLGPISSIDGLKALKGKRFTFGSESSTSGRLMPQHFLAKAGVTPKQFAGAQAGFSGSHDATIALVQSGSYQAGALNELVWDVAVKNGKVDPSKVKMIWKTPPYVDYHWLARPNLDQRFGKGFTSKVQKVILGLRPTNSRQASILKLFSAKVFIPAQESEYKPIEDVARQLGKVR